MTKGKQEGNAQSGRQDMLRLAFIAAAYFFAHQMAFLFPDTVKVLMAVWPAGGIGLAALLLSPRRLWPKILMVLFVTGNVANFISGRPFMASAGFMMANILESMACAWLISWWCGDDVRFARVHEVLVLIAPAKGPHIKWALWQNLWVKRDKTPLDFDRRVARAKAQKPPLCSF